MSLIPAFKIGLWNAWIIIVLSFLTSIIPSLINKEVSARGMEKWKDFTKTEKIVVLITHALVGPALVIYSIFLPLKIGTVWFYVGIPICFMSLVMNLMAGVAFATTPLDELVTKGVYSISRHPAYLGGFLQYVGIGIACASWISLLCAVVWIISFSIGVIDEERFLLENYGKAYREYMNRTPRWIGIPKSKKKL
ncbi:MAG: isoprenylcysteine carboxylmethyltransferase family protein [Candidatus Humimicrobiia bacterium]